MRVADLLLWQRCGEIHAEELRLRGIELSPDSVNESHRRIASCFDEIAQHIARFVNQGGIVVGHNVGFDLLLFSKDLERHELLPLRERVASSTIVVIEALAWAKPTIVGTRQADRAVGVFELSIGTDGTDVLSLLAVAEKDQLDVVRVGGPYGPVEFVFGEERCLVDDPTLRLVPIDLFGHVLLTCRRRL
jgi:hypothetical protein